VLVGVIFLGGRITSWFGLDPCRHQENHAVTTRLDDPTPAQMLSWGVIAAVVVVLLAYLFLSGVQYVLG
jgi:hypothetical protein